MLHGESFVPILQNMVPFSLASTVTLWQQLQGIGEHPTVFHWWVVASPGSWMPILAQKCWLSAKFTVSICLSNVPHCYVSTSIAFNRKLLLGTKYSSKLVLELPKELLLTVMGTSFRTTACRSFTWICSKQWAIVN